MLYQNMFKIFMGVVMLPVMAQEFLKFEKRAFL